MEIKIKAFLKEEKKIVDVTSIDFSLECISYNDEKELKTIPFSSLELLQYSDCKDIKGQEIVVGDIVIIKDDESIFGKNAGEMYEIYFSKGCFRFKPKFPSSIARGFQGIVLDEDDICEIIGNRFEIPELLKEIYK